MKTHIRSYTPVDTHTHRLYRTLFHTSWSEARLTASQTSPHWENMRHFTSGSKTITSASLLPREGLDKWNLTRSKSRNTVRPMRGCASQAHVGKQTGLSGTIWYRTALKTWHRGLHGCPLEENLNEKRCQEVQMGFTSFLRSLFVQVPRPEKRAEEVKIIPPSAITGLKVPFSPAPNP